MNETEYERKLKKRIRELFPGCEILKNDARQRQGLPDLLILYNNTWAMLEVKVKEGARLQPNQVHHINRYNQMSFASIIFPENEEAVLDALQSTFASTRSACST